MNISNNTLIKLLHTVDNNQNLNEGEYLEVCNFLKNVYEKKNEMDLSSDSSDSSDESDEFFASEPHPPGMECLDRDGNIVIKGDLVNLINSSELRLVIDIYYSGPSLREVSPGLLIHMQPGFMLFTDIGILYANTVLKVSM